MASQPKERPETGQILVVIHDFTARSSDELSLARGDRVELVERDDDFGDGWYLGRHLTSNATGLFPEVYTRLAPRTPPTHAQPAPTIPTPPPVAQQPDPVVPDGPPPPSYEESTPLPETRNSDPVAESPKTTQVERHVSASQVLDASPSTGPSSNGAGAVDDVVVPASAVPKNLMTAAAVPSIHGAESPVMNETLSVIQEHISDMRTPRNGGVVDRRGANDSGSEYSSYVGHGDRRMSYINGSETDEEEERVYNQMEVSKWTAEQVAEYLASVGVESKHCDVFRDQEISGDVLLGMDQTTVFLKEFELGSVGRRLKTWQKIKALQDEVNGVISPMVSRRQTSNYSSDFGSDTGGSRQIYSNSGTPRATSSAERPGSRQNARFSQRHGGRLHSTDGQMSGYPSPGDQTRPTAGQSRPSAASVRDLNHSRRHSSIDSPSLLNQALGSQPVTPTAATAGHKKLPSFDRNWTMGAQSGSPVISRPISQTESQPMGSEEDLAGITRTTPYEFDRGYFSGTEAEGRMRNVLKKKTGSHSRNSSYTDEQRLRTATTVNRHSRFGSVDSIQQPHVSPAGQKYYGLTGSRRTPSVGSVRPAPPPKDVPSPTVTKLDENWLSGSSRSPATGKSPDWLQAGKGAAAAVRAGGFRAISDAVTGGEKARVGDQVASPTDSNRSPSRTGSSTPSAGPSFELDSPHTSKSTMASTPASRTSRKKSKKETSAYTRGLAKVPPAEAMAGSDYSGWMKKKSTNLMTTWKSRLFILKGRRLSYYYSENDTEEKGLIDISFHRVLPADNDRLTGLHATLTGAGATASPTSATAATTEARGGGGLDDQLAGMESDAMFIFKLVPPRAGLSRAVTFTKPTVHYFAVPNVALGRLWMAALMKATIDRDDATPVTTTYQQKTISLARARQMRHRPPALMGLDERVEEGVEGTGAGAGLNIRGFGRGEVGEGEREREDGGEGEEGEEARGRGWKGGVVEGLVGPQTA